MVGIDQMLSKASEGILVLPKFSLPDEKDYNNLISKLVDFFSKFEEVVSICQVGSISFPGLSDVDLLVVLDEDRICKSHRIKVFVNETKNFLRNLEDREKYILYHPPIFVSSSIFRDILMVLPSFTIRNIGKEPIKPNIPSRKDLYLCKILQFLDISQTFLGGYFHVVLLSKAFDVRRILMMLNSAYGVLNSMCGMDRQYFSKISSKMKTFYKNLREIIGDFVMHSLSLHDLIYTIRYADDISMSMSEAFKKYLEHKALLSIYVDVYNKPSIFAYYLGRSDFALFYTPWNASFTRSLLNHIYFTANRVMNRKFFIFPPSHYAPLAIYASQAENSTLRKYIMLSLRTKTSVKCIVDERIKELVTIRYDILGKYVSFITRYSLPYVPLVELGLAPSKRYMLTYPIFLAKRRMLLKWFFGDLF